MSFKSPKFRKYKDENNNTRYDRIEGDGNDVTGLFQKDIDEAKKKGYRIWNLVDETKKGKTVKRKAGDEIIDKLLADYEKELDIEADAIRYVSNRRPDLDLLKATGQSYGNIEEELMNLKELRGNKNTRVPAPLIDRTDDGHELRIHTRYGKNDVTGEQQVEPFMDTDGINVLTTEYGRLPKENRQKANEYVQTQALRLMERGPVFDKGSTGSAHWQTDFGIMENDVPVNVEGMVTERGLTKPNPRYRGRQDRSKTTAIPFYTNIYPNRPDFNRFKSMEQEVRSLIGNELGRLPRGSSELDAIESLIGRGVVGPNDKTRYGKALKSTLENVEGKSSDVYEKMIITGYPSDLLTDARSVQRGNPERNLHPLARDMASSKVAIAPDTIHMVEDMVEAMNYIKNRPESRSILTHNRGESGRGHHRTQVRYAVPTDSDVFSDATVMHPYTQQLLRNLPLR